MDDRFSRTAWLGIAAFAVAATGCAKLAGNGSGDKPAPQAPGGCQLTTGAQWTDFMKTAAGVDGWLHTCEEGDNCDSDFYAGVQQNVQAVLDQCAPFIAQNPKIAACTQNLRTYLPAWMHQHDPSSLGFIPDNATYLAAEEAADKPAGMMTPPPEIIAAIPDPQKVVEAARLNGWRYIVHDSALAPMHEPLVTADITPGAGARTFIYRPDPSGKFDQWMLLNLGDPAASGQATSINTTLPMSFIGVQKTDAAGHPLAKIRVNFRDFALVKGPAGTYAATPKTDGNNGKCYSCHPSGLRQLINYHTTVLEAKPVKGEAGFDPTGANVPDDFAFTRLKELNAIIHGYGLPDWNGTIDPAAHGPILGKDQGCTQCHDGTTRGVLTVSTSLDQIWKKVFNQLSMPPEPTAPTRLLEGDILKNPALTNAEDDDLRALLDKHGGIAQDFEASRAPALAAWLTATACE